VNFELTDQQKSFHQVARSLAEKEIRPKAERQDARGELERGTLRALAEHCMMGVAVPVEYGGGGMDHVSYALALMDISGACASTGTIMFVNNSLYCFPLMAYGTHEQKKMYLQPCASGNAIGCYALTEDSVGSDFSAMKTRALMESDEWVIHGKKRFVAGANTASYVVITALTRDDRGRDGLSMFVSHLKDTPGVRVGHLEQTLGIVASGTAKIFFENARLPVTALLGRLGEGYDQVSGTQDGAWVGVASQAVGIGRAVLDEALAYSRSRQQFGKAIGSFQAIQWKLADMATSLDAAQLLTLKAAWLKDNGKPFQRAAAMAKMYASDASMRAAVEGIQILGAHGYCKGSRMERFLRDAKICQIYHGTNELLRLKVAGDLVESK
jgi:alkylation response protein AidB-like acyl-CoA dehydrogenase